MLRIYDGDDLGSLPAGLWGIREPDLSRPNGMGLRENGTPAVPFHYRSRMASLCHILICDQNVQPWTRVST
jgi:hypothetical protein